MTKVLAVSLAVAALLQSGPDVESLDPAFQQLVAKGAKVQKLAGGMQFTEGPVWVNGPGGGSLIFSDLRANELKRWASPGGLTTFRTPSGSANGNTLDREGRLLSAEHGGRVSRTEKDGSVVTLVDSFEGKKLSSPNDLVVTRDGRIWFTDPEYGLAGRTKETPGNYVYRFDPATKALTPIVTDMPTPNGLCFSADESVLYVANSSKPAEIRAYSIKGASLPAQGRTFASIDNGIPDGIRCDERGNVWSSAGDGAQVFAPSGNRIGRILLPESAANLAFGGPSGRTLYLTARTSLYAIETLVRDASQASRP